jgi:predicted DCC family thiol-disulfide oxidoreductase YuxK
VSGARHRILYDADCGLCRWSLGWLLRWDRRHELEPVALQDPQTARLLAEMTEERRMASWHLVDSGGEVASAGAAVAPLLRLLPGGALPARIVGQAPKLVERAYRWTADHRAALGGLVTAGARERADRLIESRAARNHGRLA